MQENQLTSYDFPTLFDSLQLEGYKYKWADFCKRSYVNQENPPTEEMYIDYLNYKKESGATSKEIYNSFLYIRKVALLVYGQNLKKWAKLQSVIPHHSDLNTETEDKDENIEIPEEKIVPEDLPKYIKPCEGRTIIPVKKGGITRIKRTNFGRGVDFIENKDIWKADFFKDKHGRQLEAYKFAWGGFCKLSYFDQSRPPTEEEYIDFIQQKIEEGRSDTSIYNTYSSIKKVALHAFGQKLAAIPRLRALIPHHSRGRKKESELEGFSYFCIPFPFLD